MLKRVIAFGLMLMILLGCAAFAEEEIEFTLEDIVELEEVPVYGEVDWNFPVDLKDMDPVMIRLANKHCLLSKEDKPDPIMSMVSRKANKDGSNANGGVNKASGSKMQLQETCGLALVERFEGALKDGIKLYLKSAAPDRAAHSPRRQHALPFFPYPAPPPRHRFPARPETPGKKRPRLPADPQRKRQRFPSAPGYPRAARNER